MTRSGPIRVAVWGTGNVGRPALRAVAAHRDLELVAAIVATQTKVGRDAGELAGIGPLGVRATDDPASVLALRPDAMVYTASGDFRPAEAEAEITACLTAGINVVSSSLYGMLHPPSAPAPLAERIRAACAKGRSSLFVSGIDPGWAQDVAPLLLSGVAGRIDQLRVQEIFDYATYHAPDAVRALVGFGTSLEATPPMLLPTVPTSIWGPMVRSLAEGLDVALEEVVEHVERRPLTEDIEVPGMGTFDAGTQGAVRFEVRGMVRGEPQLVVEHVTRIGTQFGADAAPDWPQPPAGRTGCHRILIEGRPRLEVTIEADDGSGNPAEGGNATAAGRLVAAIPAVCAAAPGPLGALDLPLPTGRGLL